MNIYRKFWWGVGLSALTMIGSAMGCADEQTQGAMDPEDEDVAEAHDNLVEAQQPRKVSVLDLAGGAPGVERYREAWGESAMLSGWLDRWDLHLAGDFRGLGHDQVLHINRDYAAGAGKLMMVDYSSGTVPGAAPYWESWGQSPMLSGWLESEDRQLPGDFMGLGHDQVMFINRDYGPGAGKVMVLDYASGVVPGVARYWESWGQSALLSGWLDNADRQYVGDFMGLGHAQVMYINRDYGPGAGKVMIVDYAGGTVPGVVKYWESWGQSALLSGWLEDADRQYVGDFMGLGHAQVMYINRNYGAGAGKVMIVDYAGGAVPGAVKYWESWDQSPFLGGWLDDGDLQIAGDFKGLGRDQMLYVNTQNAGNGKLMAVDYASGQVPGQAVYFESWLQSGLLDDLLGQGDLRVVGDFTGVGHAELESFNLDDTFTLAAKFAPRLRFDGAASTYPMSAQQYYDQQVLHPTSIPGVPGGYTIVQNTSYAPIAANQVPTYYQVIGCGTSQLRIKYWWFYGHQDACTPGFGNHNGDWEDVTLTLSEDRSQIAAITFSAHGDRYTRLAIRGGFELEEGTHPIVYPGKIAHASYYTQGGIGTCGFWDDWHNNGDGSHMDSWKNLVSLDTGMEPWMIADRAGGFDWGPNGANDSGVGTHPTRQGPVCHDNACDWGDLWGVAGAMGHTQCEAGDDDSGSGCIARCEPGYWTYPLTCTDWNQFPADTYSRQLYGYDWPIPVTDVGLLSYAY